MNELARGKGAISVGVDIGGTFTDFIAIMDDRVAIAKIRSTPADPALAVIEGLERITAELDRPGAELRVFAHGTTVAINAVIEKKGARVGFLTTKGFEDVIEIGRTSRSNIYDLDCSAEAPGFLSPRRFRLGIAERLDAQGGVVQPLDEAAVLEAARRLVEEETVDAIAIGFLFAFLNPAHEHRARAIIKARYPDCVVVVSSDVDPRFREYERFTTTLLDAYLRPVVAGYTGRLSHHLRDRNPAGEFLVMKSSGGLSTDRYIARHPIALLKSGLAGGVRGASAVALAAGHPDIISIDIGGTSCDVAVVQNGEPLVRPESRIETYPVRVSMVDVNTIGAGGGSIAWVDQAGGLHVGPRSAGSDPGPACYGKGGEAATVTDASIVLGYLNPDNFAGGRMALDPALAHAAVGRVAERLGLGVEAAAWGIHRVINEVMASEIGKVSLMKGLDPRRFALMALGGAGPVHAVALGRTMRMPSVIVPRYPGLLAAYGLLVSDVTHDRTAPFHGTLDETVVEQARAVCAGLAAEAIATLAEDGARPEEITLGFTAQLRYRGQSFEIDVAFDPNGTDWLQALKESFHQRHRALYGIENREREIEPVAISVVATWTRRRHGEGVPAAGRETVRGPATRRAYDPGLGAFRDFTVRQRGELEPGEMLKGPMIIEQLDTTTVIPTGIEASVDAGHNLILRLC